MLRTGWLSAALLIAALVMIAACGGKHAASTPAIQPAAAAPEFVPVPTSEMPTLPVAAAPEADGKTSYVVAVEDVLEISVYGDPDLTRQVPVRPDGMISYTFVGDVLASGRTIEEIRAALKDNLSTYLRSPEVTVIAKEFGRQKIYVGGEVRQPGVFYVTPRENTLVDVVYRAGMVTEKADLGKAVLVRGGRLVPVDFLRALKGDLASNVSLEDNDLVFVPEAADRYIYVLGEVRTQNALETTVPLSIISVIAKSGGMQPMSAKTREVAVLRGGLRAPQVAIVNYNRLIEGDLSQNIMVMPGDIVYVPISGLGRYNQFIEQILRTFTLLFQGRVVQQGFQ